MEKKKNNLNEQLKRVEQEKKAQKAKDNNTETKLDDSQRVKVLSPGRLVLKRFIRNKLAIVGTAILIFMFVFSFLGPFLYAYRQDEIFYKFDTLNVKYAMANNRIEYNTFIVDENAQVDFNVRNMLNSDIYEMIENNESHRVIKDSKGNEYYLDLKDNGIYTLSTYTNDKVGEYSTAKKVAERDFLGKFSYFGDSMTGDFETLINNAISATTSTVEYEGKTYSITSMPGKKYSITLEDNSYTSVDTSATEQSFIDALVANLNNKSFEYNSQQYMIEADATAGLFTVYVVSDAHPVIVATNYAISSLDIEFTLSNNFKTATYMALCCGDNYVVDNTEYSIIKLENGDIIIKNVTEDRAVAQISTFVINYYDGKDIYDLDYKAAVKANVLLMKEENKTQSSFIYQLQKRDQIDGQYLFDENGEPELEDITMYVTRELDVNYIITCDQTTYLMDIYASPSSEHLAGTDNNGMDVLARMMYGGRISLLVGFVVVIIEVILGIILGGIAGYFGGWIDTIIMRLVDVFNCIPTLPILLIIGAFFDHSKMDPYLRLVWLMAVLGFLGWAYVARLVRGQILSLREQEFMVATEATGISINRRIFRHLIPNVMPQLIVTATAGLGGVILTESTLSFLGLGVKHPLSTWGVMINSVTGSTEQMTNYLYIWIPVGLLICLTVVAFNFVGDGLRDAFDPKMKR